MDKEEQRFEAPEKPEIEDIKIIYPDAEDFNDSEKAEAIIKNLSLEVGSIIRQDDEGGEQYTINPRMVLRGTSPQEYQDLVDNVKKILTKKETYAIDRYIKAKKDNKKRRDEIYYSVDKRTDKFYKNYEVRENIKDEVVKNALLELKKSTHGFSNTIYHLLNKDDDAYLICYKNAWFNKAIPNQQEWSEENDGEYRVLTDSEADMVAQDYFDDDYMWKQAVESGNTTLGQSDWEEWVIDMDGRGHLLNGYDGCEEHEDVNGTDYYIYRTN